MNKKKKKMILLVSLAMTLLLVILLVPTILYSVYGPWCAQCAGCHNWRNVEKAIPIDPLCDDCRAINPLSPGEMLE